MRVRLVAMVVACAAFAVACASSPRRVVDDPDDVMVGLEPDETLARLEASKMLACDADDVDLYLPSRGTHWGCVITAARVR
jgi:hypothetical protein